MKTLIQFAYHQASPYKTEKSIYNIITGKKSHQTFFDAVSLNLFTLFGIQKNLSWETFLTYITHEPNDLRIPTNNQATFQTLNQTFENIQLLIQTLSHLKHQSTSFMPVSSQIDTHLKVKQVYHQIKHQHLEENVYREIHHLFKKLNQQQPQSVIHYFLTGYEEGMYTAHQVALIEKVHPEALTVLIYKDLYYLHSLLGETEEFPILTQCRTTLKVSQAVYRTFLLIKEGHSIESISQKNRISVNTVYDHIIDLFINDYLEDYRLFINETQQIQSFAKYYERFPKQRLKFYKNKFDMFTYFEIKLIIICITKGVLHA